MPYDKYYASSEEIGKFFYQYGLEQILSGVPQKRLLQWAVTSMWLIPNSSFSHEIWIKPENHYHWSGFPVENAARWR